MLMSVEIVIDLHLAFVALGVTGGIFVLELRMNQVSGSKEMSFYIWVYSQYSLKH